MHASLGRRRTLLAAAATFVAVVALPAVAAETDGVVAPIQELVGGLLKVMKAGHGTPFLDRFNMLAPVIDETFDLRIVLRDSIGSMWESLPSEQQQMVAEAFRRYTVASYVTASTTIAGNNSR